MRLATIQLPLFWLREIADSLFVNWDSFHFNERYQLLLVSGVGGYV